MWIDSLDEEWQRALHQRAESNVSTGLTLAHASAGDSWELSCQGKCFTKNCNVRFPRAVRLGEGWYILRLNFNGNYFSINNTIYRNQIYLLNCLPQAIFIPFNCSSLLSQSLYQKSKLLKWYISLKILIWWNQTFKHNENIPEYTNNLTSVYSPICQTTIISLFL